MHDARALGKTRSSSRVLTRRLGVAFVMIATLLPSSAAHAGLDPGINWTFPTTVSLGSGSSTNIAHPVYYSDSSDGAVTFTVDSGPCSVSGSYPTVMMSASGYGTCVVTVHVAATASYDAGSVTKNIENTKPTPFIFFSGASVTYGTARTLSASSNSDGAVTYSLDAGDTSLCAISGDQLFSLSGSGTCHVTATYAATANYATGSSTASFTLAKATPTLAFTSADDALAYGQSRTLTTTSASPGAVSYSSDSANCSIAADEMTAVAGAGTCTITATQAATADYSATTTTQVISLAKADQNFVFTEITDPHIGDEIDLVASGDGTGAIDFSSDSAFCSISGTTLTILAAGPCTITAMKGGDANYNGASAEQAIDVPKDDQTITFAPLGDKTYGAAPFDVSATAGSGEDVTFTTSGNCTNVDETITVGNVGTCTVTAHAAGNVNYNAAPDVSQTFNIDKADQTITFNVLADKTYGDDPIPVSATATSDLTVTFSASGNCSYASGSVTLTGAGSCTVTAHQAGNSNYNAATDVDRTFTIGKSAQDITFNALGDKTYGASDFGVTATASSGLTVTFTTSGNCTNSGATITVGNAGSCTVTAHQAGDADYDAAPDLARSFTINKADQTITFNALGNKTYGDDPFTVSGSATSTLALTFTTSGDCSNSSATVTITGAGSCTVTAHQSGNANYNAAADVDRAFTIAKADQTISLATPTDKTYGDDPFAIPGSASSDLALTFTTTGQCTNTEAIVTVTGAGTCIFTAHQAGNANYNAAPDVDRTFTIAKADQTIDFSPHADVTAIDDPFTVSATATSSLTVTFTAAGTCTNSGATITITAIGTCTVTAHQAGNVNYNAAPDVDRSFSVVHADQTITFGALADKTFGDAPFALTATASSGLPVSYATDGPCSESGGTLTMTGAGFCTVSVTQAGDSQYNPAPDVGETFQIFAADQTITFDALDDRAYSPTPFTVAATASSGLEVTFTADGACSNVDATVTITGVGSCTVTASQEGDDDYNPATDVARTFTVSPADQTITFAPLAGKTMGDAPFAVSATASSGLAVSFSASGTCSVAGSTVTLSAAGTCNVIAHQAGNANYNAAPDVTRSFAVAAAPTPPTTTPPDISLNLGFDVGSNVSDATVTVSAHDLLPGSTADITLHSTPRVLARVLVDDTGAFTTTVKLPADLEAGDHRLIVEGTGADGTPVTKTQAFTVGKGGVITNIAGLNRTVVVVPAPSPVAQTAPAQAPANATPPVVEMKPAAERPAPANDSGSAMPFFLLLSAFAVLVIGLVLRRRVHV